MKRLNVIVVGTGMYVCGRGTGAYGTIMPALNEHYRAGGIGEIYVAGRTASGIKEAAKKIRALNRAMGVNPRVKYYHAEGNGLKGYIKAMKDIPKPACAIIAVPDDIHKEVASAAMRNGLHALVVKPLVPTVKEAEELVKLQAKTGLYGAVEFHKRFDAANLKLRDTVRNGMIGDPLYFIVEFSQRKTIPEKIFRKWVSRTNIFQYLGIHYVDMVSFVTGASPKRAMAIGQKGWLRSEGIDVFDSVEAFVEWELPGKKRFTSAIFTNWVDPESTSAMSDQKIKVIGTRGRFESDQKDRGITIVTDSEGTQQPNPYFCSSSSTGGRVSYSGYGIESITTFFRDVSEIEEGRISPEELEGRRPTFKDSLVPTKVLEAVNTSLKCNGRWVEIR